MPIANVDDSTATPDRELLRAYATAGSNEALAEIVRRHVDLVYGCASRQMRDATLAEDVTQAVFLILQKKFHNTGRSHEGVLLTGWLVNAAYFASRDALRRKARRIKHERRAAAMRPLAAPPEADDETAELHRHVDEAIARLPAKDRNAIVLRFLQARSFNEVSAALGVSVDAAEKRVSRALEKLRTMLTAKGVSLPAMVLGSALLSLKVANAPASLVVGGASASAQAIAGSVLRRWSAAAAIKIAAGLAILLTITAVIAIPLLQSAPPTGPNTVAQTPIAPAVESKPANPRETEGSMDVLVTDEDGKPLPGVTLSARSTRGGGEQWTKTTDANGHCVVDALTGDSPDLVIDFSLHDHTAANAWWPANDVRGGLPPTYKLTLPKRSPVGGNVIDEDGKPVVGASVYLPLSVEVRAGYVTLSLSTETGTTDAQGHWQINDAPAKFPVKARICVGHPDYLPENDWNPVDESALHAMKIVTTIRKGITLNGAVTDTDGLPIAGAIVGKGDNRWNPKPNYEEFTTDAAGRFTIPRVSPSDSGQILTARAKGFGPETVSLSAEALKPSAAPIQFKLDAGRTVRGIVTDKSGKPLAGIYVDANSWGKKSLSGLRPTTLALSTRTGADGKFEFVDCPLGSFDVRAYGENLNEVVQEFGSTVDSQKFVLLSKFKIHGSVTDATTRQKIAKFKVVVGTVDGPMPNQAGSEPNMRWHTEDSRDLGDGWYEVTPELGDRRTCKLRIYADGYRPATSKLFKADEGDTAYDFQLEKDAGLGGIVLNPDGTPAAGARAMVSIAGSQPNSISDGQFDRDRSAAAITLDRDARLTVPAIDEPFEVIVIGDAGYLRVNRKALNPASATQPATLTLQPWAIVEGTLTRHGKPAAGVTMNLNLNSFAIVGSKLPPMFVDYTSQTTDANGRFKFARVIPEPINVYASERVDSSTTRRLLGVPVTNITPKPGQTTTIFLGRAGRAVIGKFVPPPGVEIDWKDQSRLARFEGFPNDMKMPDNWEKMSEADQSGWVKGFSHSLFGIAYQALHAKVELPSAEVEIKSDGSFVAEDVPPGRYVIYLTVNGPPTKISDLNWVSNPLARLEHFVSLPGKPGESNDSPFDLGPLTLTAEKPTTQPADSH